MNLEEQMQSTAENLLVWAFARRFDYHVQETLHQAAERVLRDPKATEWQISAARTFLDGGNTYPTRLRRASAQAAAQFVMECAEGEE